MKYYLLDLERSIGWGNLYYWEGNKHGYTYKISEAGLFSEEAAAQIVKSDIDKKTIMISADSVEKILKEGL